MKADSDIKRCGDYPLKGRGGSVCAVYTVAVGIEKVEVEGP
jgi:hypothetical protein